MLYELELEAVAESSSGFIETLVAELSESATDFNGCGNPEIKDFLINVSKCNLSLFALKRLIHVWTDEGLYQLKDCPFNEARFIFVCNLIVRAGQKICVITDKCGCIIDIPKDFLDRVANREELFQGWTTKGFKFLTPYWKESFESGIRDPESSTFADEFSVITSIFSTHSDFIHDLAWQKLCEDWNPTTSHSLQCLSVFVCDEIISIYIV